MENKKKSNFQIVAEVLFYLLIGALFFGSVLDAYTNALFLFSIRTALLITVIIGLLFSAILLLIRKRKIKWVTQGNTITITKLGKKIKIATIGVILLIWIPTVRFFFKQANNTDSSGNKLSAFHKNDSLFLKVLLLPFRPDISSKYVNVNYKAQLIERLAKISEKDSLKIKILDIYDSVYPKTVTEAREIGNMKNADLVIWGSYEENQLIGGSDKIRIRYAILKNFEIDASLITGDSEMQELKSLSQLRNGYLQENIEYLLYWIQGLYFYKKREYRSAAKYFEIINTTIPNYADAESYFRLSEILFDLGDYRNALLNSQKYYNTLLNAPTIDSLLLSKALCFLGSNYAQLSKFDSAFNSFETAINIQRSNRDGCDDCLPFSLSNYALAKALEGNYTEADKLISESLNIFISKGMKNEVIENYLILADIKRNQGKTKEAIELNKILLKNYDSLYTADYIDRGYVYNSLALNFNDINELDQALKYVDSSLAIMEFKLPPNHLELAPIYNNKGLILINKGKFKEGIDFFKKSLKISIDQAGETNTEVAGAINNIGLTYIKWEMYDSAEVYFKRALNILSKIYDKPSPFHAITYNNLACVYYGKDELDFAIANCKKSIEIAKAVNHSEIGDYYYKLAGFYKGKGNISASLTSVRTAIKYYQQLGTDWESELKTALELERKLNSNNTNKQAGVN